MSLYRTLENLLYLGGETRGRVIGKEGEAALSRWWELGSMPANLCYPTRFLSSQRMTIVLIFSEPKINHQRWSIVVFSLHQYERWTRAVSAAPVRMIFVADTFVNISYTNGYWVAFREHVAFFSRCPHFQCKLESYYY